MVKIVEAQLIIKLVLPSEWMKRCQLMCFIVSYNLQKKGNKIYFLYKNDKSVHKKMLFFFFFFFFVSAGSLLGIY